MPRRLPLLLCAALLAGCGSSRTEPPPAPGTTAATTTAPAPTTTTALPLELTVFRARDGRLRAETARVPATRAVAAAALQALGIPATVSIDGGTAVVATTTPPTDEQVAEIVYTLTGFRTVDRVDVGGRSGLTRDDVAAYVPPIVVETPADGATVRRTFRVAGTASVFEATLVVRLVRDGKELSKRTVTASEGAPARGSFETTVSAPPGPLVVQVFSPSAVDGQPQHEVDAHVTVAG